MYQVVSLFPSLSLFCQTFPKSTLEMFLTIVCFRQYPYETLFRSQHFALLDNGCREFLFLCDFFMVTGNSALDLFNCIMGKTLSMFLVWISFNQTNQLQKENTSRYHLISLVSRLVKPHLDCF